VHSHGQRGFLFVKGLGASDVLAARPTRFPRRCTAFSTEFKFKLGEAGEHSGHHSAGRVRPKLRGSLRWDWLIDLVHRLGLGRYL
jgi:hypothetical protein